ncbi:MAG: glycerophosphodiester phosphodiesterase family protein [Thermodesulfobacteriota bacterium]
MADYPVLGPPKNHPGPLIIAHRGARSLAPENTLAAARKALAAGADMWELDLQLSTDGALVVVHDRTLERTTNAPQVKAFASRTPWPVDGFTLAELKSLDFGSWFIHTDPFGRLAAGEISPAEARTYAGLTLPTLEEALLFSRENRLPLNVEIKDLAGRPGHETVVEQTVRLIEALEMTDLVLVSSFNPEYLARIRRMSPSLAAALIVEENKSDPLPLLEDLALPAFHPAAWTVTPAQVSQLREKGYAVNVWTLNTAADMTAFYEAGASGIITDFPQVLSSLLGRRPSRSPD